VFTTPYNVDAFINPFSHLKKLSREKLNIYCKSQNLSKIELKFSSYKPFSEQRARWTNITQKKGQNLTNLKYQIASTFTHNLLFPFCSCFPLTAMEPINPEMISEPFMV
jgi:hypothetical protein